MPLGRKLMDALRERLDNLPQILQPEIDPEGYEHHYGIRKSHSVVQARAKSSISCSGSPSVEGCFVNNTISIIVAIDQRARTRC